VKKPIVILLAFVLLLPLISLAWIGLSEAGLQWCYQQLQTRVPGKLSLNNLQGRLFGNIDFSELDYQNGELQVRSDFIRLDWQAVNLLFGHVDIDALAIKNLFIQLPAKQANSSLTQPGFTVPDIPLPIQIGMQQLDIDGLLIQQGEQQYPLKQVKASVVSRLLQLEIETLNIEAEQYHFNLRGKVELAPLLIGRADCRLAICCAVWAHCRATSMQSMSSRSSNSRVGSVSKEFSRMYLGH
jgi:autotransporter translocation and assembly factor TamB